MNGQNENLEAISNSGHDNGDGAGGGTVSGNNNTQTTETEKMAPLAASTTTAANVTAGGVDEKNSDTSTVANQPKKRNRKVLIPNAVTMINLSLGIMALYFTMGGRYQEAAYAIFGAMIMDGLDGRLARRLQVVTDFGKELDSLSDLVSFGIAPALLAYAVVLYNWGRWGLLVAIIFALAGAFRLARFNVMNIKGYFLGVPITFCGPLLTLLLMLNRWIDFRVYPFIVIFLGYLMASSHKVRKL